MIGYLGMTLAIFQQTKTVAKHTQDIILGADLPNKIQTRIGFDGFHEDRKSMMERLITEIIEARLFEGLIEKGLLIETDQRVSVCRDEPAN